MTAVGFAPTWPIDGPPPLAPTYGLLPAAAAPAAGVRIIPDADAEGVERWGNSVEVYPYPADTGHTWSFIATGSEAGAKLFGDEHDYGDLPQFDSFTAYLPVTCPTWKVPDQDEFKARAIAAFDAVQSSIVAREFINGIRLPENPHLADGNGLFPNADNVTSVKNGIALLENALATTGRQGIIHCTPGVTAIASEKFLLDNKSGVIRTINGTVVIPDAGYVGAHSPTGHAGATGTEEWIYATGPVDIRRSSIYVNPENVSAAVDRTGSLVGKPNRVTYRVEREYLVIWDRQFQAAVRIDRCQDSCEAA